MTTESKARLVGAAASILALATIVVASSSSQPVPDPYWIGDFRTGDYCQYATVFQSSSVPPGVAPEGYVAACPDYTPFAKDPSQRVYLTSRPAPPAQAASKWVSVNELRTTDGPWFPGGSIAKSTVRLTPEQTVNQVPLMNSVRWFRVSIYLPNPGFNWPASSWYTLLDLHNSHPDGAGHDWPTLTLEVTRGGPKRYLAFELDGVRAFSNYENIKLLQLTRADGSRIVPLKKRRGTNARAPRLPLPFNRWHTLIFGVKFSDQGRIGNSPGWVKIFFDGKLVYDKERPNVWSNEYALWFQLQNYKQHGTAFVDGATSSKVIFADARIGDTLTSVTR